jgi:hypothetical protein
MIMDTTEAPHILPSGWKVHAFMALINQKDISQWLLDNSRQSRFQQSSMAVHHFSCIMTAQT